MLIEFQIYEKANYFPRNVNVSQKRIKKPMIYDAQEWYDT